VKLELVKVIVKLVGVLRGLARKENLVVESEIPNVREVVLMLIEEVGSGQFQRIVWNSESNSPAPSLIVLVNGRDVGLLGGSDAHLRDGDELVLISASHGG